MNDIPRFNALEIQRARVNLSDFVRSEAGATARELGFGWRGASIAPSSLNELVTEFQACRASGLPMRVYGDHCDDTIYDSPATNEAYRFMHDSRHVWLLAGFETNDELEVASCHLVRAVDAGFAINSIEYRLLWADSAGQTLFIGRTGKFVVNQLSFAFDCLNGSVDEAISLEQQRQAGLNLQVG